jgi:hypothetical protein
MYIHRPYVPVTTTNISSPTTPLRKKSISPIENSHIDNVIIPPRKSKAIPIVAPPPPAIESSKAAEIKAMLSSFEGKAIHEKKQLLGDQLFPMVKVLQIAWLYISNSSCFAFL